jgi:bifunctional non-homologous end joining protein LigD
MLATLVDQPFDEPGWTYEEKYDGVRLVAYKEARLYRSSLAMI